MAPKRNRLWLLFPALGLVCFGAILFVILWGESVLLRWKLSPGQVLDRHPLQIGPWAERDLRARTLVP